MSSYLFTLLTASFTAAMVWWMKREGERPPPGDGAALILQRGKAMRTGMMLGLVVLAIIAGLMIWMEATREYGKPQPFTIVASIGVMVIAGIVGVYVNRYRVVVTPDTIVIEDLAPTKTIRYTDIKEITENDAGIKLRLLSGGAVTISKELTGWCHGLDAIRAHWEASRSAKRY